MTASQRYSGFTLVELMIVVLIIAIISAIAIPSYNSYVMRTNRAAARSCMAEYSQFMERWYTTSSNLSYVGASPSLMGCSTDSNLNQKYTITVSNVAARTYQINATPIGTQNSRDAKCGVLTLDQAGTRGKSGTATTIQECW